MPWFYDLTFPGEPYLFCGIYNATIRIENSKVNYHSRAYTTKPFGNKLIFEQTNCQLDQGGHYQKKVTFPYYTVSCPFKVSGFMFHYIRSNHRAPSTWKKCKKVREKSRECHNYKPQPFPDPKRKRKPTNLNKHKPNKRMKSTKISSLFPKRGNRNTKRTEKHKNKMTHGKTYNKSPRRINHKATKSKTNTGITALERSVEQTTGGLKLFYS